MKSELADRLIDGLVLALVWNQRALQYASGQGSSLPGTFDGHEFCCTESVFPCFPADSNPSAAAYLRATFMCNPAQFLRSITKSATRRPRPSSFIVCRAALLGRVDDSVYKLCPKRNHCLCPLALHFVLASRAACCCKSSFGEDPVAELLGFSCQLFQAPAGPLLRSGRVERGSRFACPRSLSSLLHLLRGGDDGALPLGAAAGSWAVRTS